MQLRARVTYTWGAWCYRLQAGPAFVEYASPVSYPTPGMAADAARQELRIRSEPDPVRRALIRIGVVLSETDRRDHYKLAN